jgi:hypothetical protein
MACFSMYSPYTRHPGGFILCFELGENESLASPVTIMYVARRPDFGTIAREPAGWRAPSCPYMHLTCVPYYWDDARRLHKVPA